MNTKSAAGLFLLFALIFTNVSQTSGDEVKTVEPSKAKSEKTPVYPRSVAEAASRITLRLPEYIKKADAAALEGNRLTSDGDYQTAQEKFLEAINLLMSGEDKRFPSLDRRAAYARQLLVAIQAEIKERDEVDDEKP